jgi:6-phosphogluconolactonase (cycloisomerase 2 family)
VTSSTFARGEGPQVGRRLSADCDFDEASKRLRIKANRGSVTSAAATEVQTTLTGVVYVGSNIFGDNANSIFAFRRDAEGNVTELPGSPFLTGGSGVATATIPRFGSFESDQSIIVNTGRTRLFAVNSGSDTIAVFYILPDGGIVPAPGSPFPSGGVNPVSVGLAGDRLYVVNKNDDPMRPEVTSANFPNYTGFTVAADGTLTPIPDSTITLPSPTASPSQALISRDQRFLFGADFLADVTLGQGLLQSFRIQNSGTLAQNPPQPPPESEFQGGDLYPVPGSPFDSMGVTPMSVGLAGDRLYVVNNNRRPLEEEMLGGPLPTRPNYTGFTVAEDGSLTPIPGSAITLPSPLQVPTQALISPDHRFLFGADFFGEDPVKRDPGLLQSFQINADGTLAQNTPLAPPASEFPPGGIDLNGDGVTDRLPLGLQVHPTQPILYVGHVTSARLGVYTYDNMGRLTFVRGVPNSGLGICWVLANRAGTRLYTTNTGDDTVSVYDITDPLKPVEIQLVQLKGNGSPFQMALSPDGAFLHIVKQRDFEIDFAGVPTPPGEGNYLSVLRVNADGTLTEVDSSPTRLDVPAVPVNRTQGVAAL